MSDGESIAAPTRVDGGLGIGVDPGRAEGRSRLLLFAGLVPFALGHALRVPLAVWIGIAAVTVAFALNTAGKVVHYRRLPISRRDEAIAGATWVALALSVVGLLATYALARYGGGSGAFFWPLALAGVGFGLLHLAAQSTVLPADDADDAV
ncbi:MAG: hypothetical protein ABEK02_08385 [Haloquadratum sp.]